MCREWSQPNKRPSLRTGGGSKTPHITRFAELPPFCALYTGCGPLCAMGAVRAHRLRPALAGGTAATP